MTINHIIALRTHAIKNGLMVTVRWCDLKLLEVLR